MPNTDAEKIEAAEKVEGNRIEAYQQSAALHWWDTEVSRPERRDLITKAFKDTHTDAEVGKKVQQYRKEGSI